MKKLQLIIVLLFVSSASMASINDAYIKIMTSKIATLHNTNEFAVYQELANSFERISQKETTEWLPLYYAAFSYIHMGFYDTLSIEAKDQYFDKAIKTIEAAEKLSAANSELTALKGYAYMGKLSADAGSRGQSLSPLVMQLFGKAIALNPENPRALYLMAQMEYGMAQFFGSGTEKACGMAKKSVALFEKTDEVGIKPRWGENGAKEIMNSCQ